MVIKDIEDYAKENHIPIMEHDGIEFLTKYIKEHEEVKNILEIGCAIGYSAIRMALIRDDIHVTTIERDQERYLKAKENVSAFHLEDRITILFQDALEVELNEQYDFIFIDAAKSQYIKFFEKFTPLLSENGVVFSDNLLFHGYTKQKERIESKNLRQLVQKIRKYIVYLKENDQYVTEFYDIGDGIAVTKRK